MSQKGFISIILIVFVILAGVIVYLYFGKNLRQVSLPTSKSLVTPVPTKSDEKPGWKTYINQELSISFNYPSSWGELKENEEFCMPPGVDGTVRSYQGQTCLHISLSAPSQSVQVFLAAQSKLFAKYIPGRGGYWGDRFPPGTGNSKITGEEFVNSYCETQKTYSCVKKNNQNGVLYVKSLEDEQAIESDRKAYYYFISHANSDFPVILLSNQAFLDTLTLEESEKLFDQILSTFRFKDPTKLTVKLFFYNSNFDQKQDCLPDAVLPVEREIPRTETPIRDTIELLLKGVTQEESTEGFGSEFPYAGFKLLGASLNNGVLNLNFPEIPSFTSGGSCRVSLLNAQLDKTAKQFPEVKEITYNNHKWGMFQP